MLRRVTISRRPHLLVKSYMLYTHLIAEKIKEIKLPKFHNHSSLKWNIPHFLFFFSIYPTIFCGHQMEHLNLKNRPASRKQICHAIILQERDNCLPQNKGSPKSY